MSPDPEVLALIPAWNEASRIRPVIEGAKQHLPTLVVDDGSRDSTARVAHQGGASVVSHPHNQGKGRALLTGFQWALSRGYQAVVTLDADGQHDPADLPTFLAAYRKGLGDLIIGRRDFRMMPFPRRYTNPFGSWLLSLPLRHPIYDSQSGYRLHSRRLMEGTKLFTSGFELETEIIIEAVRGGMSIAWVPIRTLYGVGEVSYFHPLRDTTRFFGMVVHAYRRMAGRG